MPNYNENIIYELYDRDSRKAHDDCRAIVRCYKQLALVLREQCPPSRELAMARTSLEESMHHAVASCDRHQAHLDAVEKMRKDPTEDALAEEERVKAVRARYPNAKNQTLGR